MGIKKKIGIGFGVIIVSFVVLIIITQIWWASLTPEERQQLEDQRATRELQAEIDAEQEEKAKDLIESSKQKQAEREEAEALEQKAKALQQQKDEAKLSTEDIQKIAAGFESYNKSVKMLLDMCVNVETEADVRLLGSLIAERGEDFLENTSSYGAVREKLIAEGYGEHPVLGPLLSESENLVNRMSTCMEMLAWEFSG